MKIVILVSAIALVPAIALAWVPLPAYKLPSTEFTVSCGNPELAAAAQQWDAVSNLTFTGCSSNPTIQLLVIDPWPYTDRGGQTVRVNAEKRRIEIRPEYAHDLTVMLHEMGHAIGLNHSMNAGTRLVGDPGPMGAVMHWNPCNKVPGAPGGNVGPCNTLNADDIAGVQALYPDATPTQQASTPTQVATQTPMPAAATSPTATWTPSPVPPAAFPTQPTQAPTNTRPVQPTKLPTTQPTAQPLTKPLFRVVVPMVGN